MAMNERSKGFSIMQARDSDCAFIFPDPMSDDITEKVITALARVKRIPEDKIALDSSLSDLGFDSLDTITMLFELEKQFDISIADEEVRSVRSVRDIVAGVRKYVGSAPAVGTPASSD